MGSAAALIRWGFGGAVAIGVFTAGSQTSPIAGVLDAQGMKSWVFQVKGSITAGGITVQGTLDGVNFFDLAPDASGAGGQNANPITQTNAQLKYTGILYGVRGVSNGAFAGNATLEGAATP